jgi:glutathione S-transferase
MASRGAPVRRRRAGTREGEAEVRRVLGVLVEVLGGQQALVEQLGGAVAQSTISRFLAGGRLGIGTAEALWAAYPGLRRPLERVFRLRPRTPRRAAVDEMPAAHDTPASGVAD